MQCLDLSVMVASMWPRWSQVSSPWSPAGAQVPMAIQGGAGPDSSRGRAWPQKTRQCAGRTTQLVLMTDTKLPRVPTL